MYFPTIMNYELRIMNYRGHGSQNITFCQPWPVLITVSSMEITLLSHNQFLSYRQSVGTEIIPSLDLSYTYSVASCD